jgi:hypothetical protein
MCEEGQKTRIMYPHRAAEAAATRQSSGCKLIYIFKHSIMIFHRHKMFIVPLLLLTLISRISLTHSYLYGTVKAKSSSTFQSISLFTKKNFIFIALTSLS